MPVMPQFLALNPLKDMMQVDEIDYLADFVTYIPEWMISISFFKREKYFITF